MRNWFWTHPITFYDTQIKKLSIRWQKCLDFNGNYIEK